MLLLLQLERHCRPHGLQAAPGAAGRADRATREGAGGRGRPIAPHPLGHGPPAPKTAAGSAGRRGPAARGSREGPSQRVTKPDFGTRGRAGSDGQRRAATRWCSRRRGSSSTIVSPPLSPPPAAAHWCSVSALEPLGLADWLRAARLPRLRLLFKEKEARPRGVWRRRKPAVAGGGVRGERLCRGMRGGVVGACVRVCVYTCVYV